MEDPGLQELLTKTLLHAMILRQENGADMWSDIFNSHFPKYSKWNKERAIDIRIKSTIRQ